MNIARIQARIKKITARIRRAKKKMSANERKLKVGGTDRRKASLKKKIKKAIIRIGKWQKKIIALHTRMNSGKVKAAQQKAKRAKTIHKKSKKKKKSSATIKVPGEQKTTLSPEMEQRIIRAANRTFQVIGGDLLNLVQEMGGGSIKQIEVIEAVFDADRMKMYGGDDEAYLATKDMSWDELVKLGKKAFPYKTYD